MNYWIILNGVKLGPMPYDDVVKLVNSPDVPVWRQGLDNWYAASTLPEFASLFTGPANVGYMPRVPNAGCAGTQPVSDFRQSRGGDVRPMPPTYLAWSIVVMLLCCLVPGIVALVYSTKVSSLFSSGDYDGARRASENAALWIIISIVCGIVWIPFQFVLFLI